jgi:hypothetical protein
MMHEQGELFLALGEFSRQRSRKSLPGLELRLLSTFNKSILNISPGQDES